MFSFKEFLQEHPADKTRKGWMSPSGEAHIVKGEHYLDHHPSIAKTVNKGLPSMDSDDYDPTASITKAQKLGYTRYSSTGNSHMIHFDKDAPGGSSSALRALKHINPPEPTHIVVRNRPFGYGRVSGQRLRGDRHDAVFSSIADAENHIREA